MSLWLSIGATFSKQRWVGNDTKTKTIAMSYLQVYSPHYQIR